MKKIVCLLLACMMLLGVTGSIAESEYATHVDYIGSGWGLNAETDYNDAFYQYFSDRFNMTYEPYFIDVDGNDEKVSLLVNTSSMPDSLLWMGFNYEGYLEWVDQGLLKALPEGWEEKYPNLYHNMQMTGILDKITVDGDVYVIPHVIWSNFVAMDQPVDHSTVYYRKDWAKQLGYEWGDVIPRDELLEFCKKAVEAKLGDNNKTVGLTCQSTAKINNLFFYHTGLLYDSFQKMEDGYAWGPSLPGMTDAVAYMRNAYKEGAIDPDYYLKNGHETFTAGSAAAMINDGAPYGGSDYLKSFIAAHANLTAEFDALKEKDPNAHYYDTSIGDYVGYGAIGTDDGVAMSGSRENFWSATLFNPDINDEVFDRILAVTEWLSGKEGEVAVRNGVPDVDWKWIDDTMTAIERIPNAEGEFAEYKSQGMLCNQAMCGDEMSMIDVGVSPDFRAYVNRMYAAKGKGLIVDGANLDYRYFVSESKSNYAADVNSKITELVIDSSKDIETEWAQFIEDHKAVVDPLLADLNAEFFGK